MFKKVLLLKMWAGLQQKEKKILPPEMNLFDGPKGLNLGGDLTFQWLNFKYS